MKIKEEVSFVDDLSQKFFESNIDFFQKKISILAASDSEELYSLNEAIEKVVNTLLQKGYLLEDITIIIEVKLYLNYCKNITIKAENVFVKTKHTETNVCSCTSCKEFLEIGCSINNTKVENEEIVCVVNSMKKIMEENNVK